MSSIQKDLIDPRILFSNSSRFMENSMIEFLQILFSTFPKGNFHFERSKEDTDIQIEGRSTNNLEVADKRPKIVVARGPIAWQNRGIGNFIGAASFGGRGGNKFADIEEGTVGISCFSREDLESDQIAQICFNAVKMSRPILQRFGFLTIRSAQLGQRGLIRADANPELWVTPVLIQAQVTKNWTIEQSDPVKLREFLVSLLTGDKGGTIQLGGNC